MKVVTKDLVNRITSKDSAPEVSEVVKISIAATIEAMQNYFEKQTYIANIVSGEEIENCEIRPISGKKAIDYINESLSKRGLTITF